ncbi:hypothetical protein BDV12DRAFT_179071 [Aspergillus spectabilis]
MGKCLKTQNRVLGFSHPHTTSSSRSLRDWKERVDLLADKYPQASDQAESDQLPEETQKECAPAVVITKPPGKDEQRITLHQGRGRSATPINSPWRAIHLF